MLRFDREDGKVYERKTVVAVVVIVVVVIVLFCSLISARTSHLSHPKICPQDVCVWKEDEPGSGSRG